MRCGVAECRGRGEGGGVCDGLFEELFGLSGAMQADEGFGAIVEQGGIGVSGLCGDEGGVERVGLVGVAGFEVDAGEQAGDVGVVGVGGVELFEQRSGLGDLRVVARGEVGLGELGGEAGIAGRASEGRCEQGFGVGGVVLGEQNVGEGGGGLRVVGVLGKSEVAAVGVLGAGEVGGGFGDLGG